MALDSTSSDPALTPPPTFPVWIYLPRVTSHRHSSIQRFTKAHIKSPNQSLCCSRPTHWLDHWYSRSAKSKSWCQSTRGLHPVNCMSHACVLNTTVLYLWFNTVEFDCNWLCTIEVVNVACKTKSVQNHAIFFVVSVYAEYFPTVIWLMCFLIRWQAGVIRTEGICYKSKEGFKNSELQCICDKIYAHWSLRGTDDMDKLYQQPLNLR